MWKETDNSNSRGDCNHFKITQTWRPQTSPCEICGAQSGSGTGLSPSTSIFPCQCHSANAPYQKYKRNKPENLPRSNDLSENGKQWIEKYFHLVFKLLNTGNIRLYLSHDTGHAPQPRLTWQKRDKKEQSEKKERLNHNSGLKEEPFQNWARQCSAQQSGCPSATEFYVPQNLSPFLQKPTSGIYPKTDKSISYPSIYDTNHIILSSTAVFA